MGQPRYFDSIMQMPKTARYILIAFSALFIQAHCEKEAPPCVGNCGTISSNGHVVNKLTNADAANAQVGLKWVKRVGFGYSSEVIARLNTKPDGTFNFTSSIDTTYFDRGYYLSLEAETNDNFVVLYDHGVTSEPSYEFDPNIFQGRQFEVYKRANLTYRLHRNQNDNFIDFEIFHSNVDPNDYDADYQITSPQQATQKNINIATVADIYTRIHIVKTVNGITTSKLDSVKCTAGKATVYDVNF